MQHDVTNCLYNSYVTTRGQLCCDAWRGANLVAAYLLHVVRGIVYHGLDVAVPTIRQRQSDVVSPDWGGCA
jgi:hypothetical protein